MILDEADVQAKTVFLNNLYRKRNL